MSSKEIQKIRIIIQKDEKTTFEVETEDENLIEILIEAIEEWQSTQAL